MQPQDDATGILRAIRRIVRAVDLHSRALRKDAGLNVPQLLTLEAIEGAPRQPVLASQLVGQVGVSPGTMSGIIDRLVREGLVIRTRDKVDRRRVQLTLSPAGRERVAGAPVLLQTRVTEQLARLPAHERAEILNVLERVGALMEARDLDASPVLTSDPSLDPLTDR